MATRARLHWFWRGAIAVVAGLALPTICGTNLAHRGIIWIRLYPEMYHWLGQWTDFVWAVTASSMIFFGFPCLATAFGVYGLLTHWFGRHGSSETHCRRCDHILRGLSEPRCPECGEAI